ncbi:piggyBac transposable element-derived protein 3-like [Sitophilus oryzae]|uniref:PiggyBac transposable element-derived protein 3-like n=1 Tax=Sitophilus oryzae TaxID=7048 RepID=A0A6J2YWU8_SITOR|nr:piggyBac transposable element-derived protein 3-like [Sitophilus oryzae]
MDLSNFASVSCSKFYVQKNKNDMPIPYVPKNLRDSNLSGYSSSEEEEEIEIGKGAGDHILAFESESEEERAMIDKDIVVSDSDMDSDYSNIEEEEPIRPPKKKTKKQTATYNWTEDDLPMHLLLPPEVPQVENIKMPLEYFTKFFSFDLMQKIVDQTNLYCTQVTGSSLDLDNFEFTSFLTIVLTMGIIKLPAILDYWSIHTRIPQVADAMPARRFKKIRRFLHFADNSQITEETKDRFYKIRPLINKIKANCRQFQLENQYSIDETMVPYKGTFAGNLRQYIKNKPHKWGFKLFVRAGVSGFIYDFIPYQGTHTFDELRDTPN